MTARSSDLTVTDMFCGAGGSSLGAHANGLRVRLAMNHWKLAIETHNTNFQDTDHACTDIQACDPRAFYSTDILLASPECTNHSLAKGVKRKRSQIDAFESVIADPDSLRSRATMWDVPRFAEVHRYRAIIVENVVDATHWVMFEAWIAAMHALGYRHRIVYLNSMFAHPTPQSRDRMYVVFWRKGNRAPDLDFFFNAWCGPCARDVESVQSWKRGRNWGRYKRQYIYCCPKCAGEVTPYYYAALNAIDWSIPATRIGDRPKPLKPRTRARIKYGLDNFGRVPLIVHTRMTSGVGDRVRSAATQPIGTQVGDVSHALCHPFVLNTSHSSADARAQSAVDPLPTQTTAQEFGLAMPFLVPAGSNEGKATPITDPSPTITCSDRLAVTIPPGFVMTYRNQPGVGYHVRPFTAPLDTLVGNAQERIILGPAALMTMRDSQGVGYLLRGLEQPIATQVGSAAQDAIISRSPFLVSYYGQGMASGMQDPVPTVTTLDRHGVVEPGTDVDDCYFRMIAPHESGAAMAFPSSYIVLGNNREKVKQFGNAVTPPAMDILVERVVESLHPERARRAA